MASVPLFGQPGRRRRLGESLGEFYFSKLATCKQKGRRFIRGTKVFVTAPGSRLSKSTQHRGRGRASTGGIHGTTAIRQIYAQNKHGYAAVTEIGVRHCFRTLRCSCLPVRLCRMLLTLIDCGRNWWTEPPTKTRWVMPLCGLKRSQTVCLRPKVDWKNVHYYSYHVHRYTYYVHIHV